MAARDVPLDRILIRDLALRCIIGLEPHEREHRQDVVIHITLHADLRRAGQSDRIEDTVNYKTIKRKVVDLVEGSSFLLVERLAQRIADVCLAEEGVQRVEVTLDKPGALRFARSVAVEIVREREGKADG
jgi:dihydroneopterin aldolase/D-erythro-7,8-dihydroneopterin triphosphate epimerase